MKRGIVLLIAGIVLMGGFLVWDMQTEKTETRKKEQSAVLFPFKPDQVNELTVTTPEGKTTRLTKTVDGWMLEEPFKDSADSSFTDDFVDRAAKDKSLDVAKEGPDIDWKTFGFDKPTGKITLKSQTGESRTLEISKQHNFEQNNLARIVGEEKVLVIPAAWETSIAKGPLDFRDKRLFRHTIGSVDRLTAQTPQGAFILEMKDGKWVATGRKDLILDQNRVRELLSQINETRAADFVSETAATPAEKKSYGLDRPFLTLTLGMKEKTWVGEIGVTKEKVPYAQTSDPVFVLKLEAGALNKFEKMDLDGLRDRKLPFDFNKSLVQKIELETPLKKSAFVRKGESWELGQDVPGVSANQEQLKKLIDSLKESSVTRYAEPKRAQSFQPQNRLKFLDAEGKSLIDVSWAAARKEKIGGEDQILHMARTDKYEGAFWWDEASLGKLNLDTLTSMQTPSAPETPSKAAM